jgi:hypothetical protein
MVEKFERKDGRDCKTCGIPQAYTHIQWREEGFGMRHDVEYSCPHFEELVKSSPCKYCGKKNTPVRQVPAPVPISDCYCDDCADACRAQYESLIPKVVEVWDDKANRHSYL